MIRVLTIWLAVSCVIAGLHSRALGAQANHANSCHRLVETCCDGSDQVVLLEQDHHEGEECPTDHHHHSRDCCVHGMILGVEHILAARVAEISGTLLRIQQHGEVPDDGPFLGSEKPPLI